MEAKQLLKATSVYSDATEFELNKKSNTSFPTVLLKPSCLEGLFLIFLLVSIVKDSCQ